MKTMFGYVLIAFLGLMFLSSAPANLASTKEPRTEPEPPEGDEQDPHQGDGFMGLQSSLKINQPSMRAIPPVSVKQGQSSVMEEIEALDKKCQKIEALLRRRVK
jgi:hypothetical protein